MLVVGLAAGMVAQPPRPVGARPARSTRASPPTASSPSSPSVPGSVGGNEMHVLITPPGGSITPGRRRHGSGVAAVGGHPQLAGHAHVGGAEPLQRQRSRSRESGEWTLEFIVNVTDNDSALLKATVTIP